MFLQSRITWRKTTPGIQVLLVLYELMRTELTKIKNCVVKSQKMNYVMNKIQYLIWNYIVVLWFVKFLKEYVARCSAKKKMACATSTDIHKTANVKVH